LVVRILVVAHLFLVEEVGGRTDDWLTVANKDIFEFIHEIEWNLIFFWRGLMLSPVTTRNEAIRKECVLLFKSRTTFITWALTERASSPIQVKVQSTIPMVCLNFYQHGDDESAAMRVEELNQANVDEITGLHFDGYCFEDIIVRAVIDLFHRAFQKGRQLERLNIEDCTGRVDEVLQAASSLDMFDKISLKGDSDDLSQHLSLHGFWSISSAMKYNKRLTKLELQSIELTRQQAAALGAGLVTSNSQHFKELHMDSVTFADGAITEFASGLKRNSSLCILTVDQCILGDSELVELIDAVDSHPSLKELSLGWNLGQRHTLVALGKVLSSRSCQLQWLDFSSQGADDGDGLTGLLGILAQGLQGNKSLTRLNLSSNGLLDKDIDDLGQILATCQLEKLNLRRNEITHSGCVSLTQNIPKSLKALDFSGNDFDKEEAACHTLKLFDEHPQLWDGGYVASWDLDDSKLPIHQKIQHFKDLNRCGSRVLLMARGGAIPLSVWPIVLARANRVLHYISDSKERTPNAIFHLLQGPALMQRRFDRDSSQATCVVATSSKRGPAETIDDRKESAKKGRSE
jgi:hypothetical protein